MESNEYARSSFDDMVFEEKNKAYGAYMLRRRYGVDILLALLLGLIVLGGILKGEDIYNWLFPKKHKKAKVTVNTDEVLTSVEVKKTEKKTPPPPKLPPIKVEQIKYLPVVVKRDDEARDTLASQQALLLTPNVGTVTQDGAHEHITETVGQDIGGTGTEDNEVYTTVQEQPSFKGGQQKYYEYLDANFKYPQQSIDDEKEGVVWVFFIVEKDGSITDVKVIPGKGLDSYCNAEAIRVVKNMPHWIPGKNNGVAVRTKHQLGITFELE